ncbi:MAG: hypothetical protein QW499_05150 [Desulfurococcaceae archaeon]
MFYEAVKAIEAYVAVITMAIVPVLAIIISSISLKKEAKLQHIIGALHVYASTFFALTSSNRPRLEWHILNQP